MDEVTLVIGDPHCEETDDLRRFKALSSLIIERKPDNIVLMGDFLTLDSLSRFDRDKRAVMEGRRFKNELAHGRDAMDLLMSSIEDYNYRRSLHKKKRYTPYKVFIIGNHCQRFEDYTDIHSELKGIVDIYKEIGVYDYGWQLVPYKQYIRINGVDFTHVPMNGINKPMGGVTAARKIVQQHEVSVVYGHSHILQLETFTRHGGNTQIKALNVGCYFEDTPSYAMGSLLSKDWWKGVVFLHHTGYNEFDIETIGLNTIIKNYE